MPAPIVSELLRDLTPSPKRVPAEAKLRKEPSRQPDLGEAVIALLERIAGQPELCADARHAIGEIGPDAELVIANLRGEGALVPPTERAREIVAKVHAALTGLIT